MNLSYKVTQIGVHPSRDGKSNVIAQVMWHFVAERNGHTSVCIADTMLPIDGFTEFTPIEQVTKEQVLSWAIAAEGGQAFLDSLMTHHERALIDKEKRVGVQNYLGTLGFELDGQKNQFLVGEIPVEVL